jgi:hypothetical protein
MLECGIGVSYSILQQQPPPILAATLLTPQHILLHEEIIRGQQATLLIPQHMLLTRARLASLSTPQQYDAHKIT